MGKIKLHHTMYIVRAPRKERYFGMFEEKKDLTRSIARKLAREIRPEEMSAVAAGTVGQSGSPPVDDK
jgi:hypothetical protein